MAVNISGTSITFNDATTQSTAAVGGIYQTSFYSSSQTITIPAGATKALITLIGAGGAVSSCVGGGGGGGTRKYLTDLIPGNTLALTVGAGGSGSGGTSSLASGNQTISTLTANGGTAGGAPGNASGGDLNVPGQTRPTIYQSRGGTSAFHYGSNGQGYGGGGNGNGQSGGCEIIWFK